jgi:hypothetical protein
VVDGACSRAASPRPRTRAQPVAVQPMCAACANGDDGRGGRRTRLGRSRTPPRSQQTARREVAAYFLLQLTCAPGARRS